MRILGIDPGLRCTGYGLIDSNGRQLRLLEAGIVRTQSNQPISQRLHTIYEGLHELVDEHRPDYVVIEKIFAHYKHPTTAILMGHARGVVCLIAGMFHIPLENIPSTRVKKAVVSQGHASKLQVQRTIQRILSLKQLPEPCDVADALAIAIAFAFTHSHSSLSWSNGVDMKTKVSLS